MAFQAAIPLIAAGISAAGSIAGGSGGKKGGSSGNTNSLQERDLQNFAPFQEPAISSVFNALNPGLLAVPPTATAATNSALSSAMGLLGQLRRQDPLGDLSGVRDIVNQDLGGERFGEAQERFEEIFDEAERLFGTEINRDAAERAVGLLLPTAEGRFLPGGDLANRFFEPGVVEPTLADARNQIATLFSGAGRLTSPSAAQTVARETGRIAGGLRSGQFNLERGNQLNAGQAIGTFDANEGIRRLNAVSGQTNARLAATQGIQSTLAAEQARRNNLLGIRAGISGQQLALQQSLQSQLPELAIQQSTLPFIPISNFANIAFQPLGQTGTVLSTGGGSQTQNPGILNSAAGGALLGQGLLGGLGGKGGGTTSASSGVAGFGPLAANLGPLAGIGNAPVAP